VFKNISTNRELGKSEQENVADGALGWKLATHFLRLPQ
jgi:hypothetical protein